MNTPSMRFAFPARQRLDATPDRIYVVAREMADALSEHATHPPESCRVAALLDAWGELQAFLLADDAQALHRSDAKLRRLGVEYDVAAADDPRRREGTYS